jgi:serine protease AprX
VSIRRAGTAAAAGLVMLAAPCAALTSSIGTTAGPVVAASAHQRLIHAVVAVRPGTTLPLRPAHGRVIAVYRHLGAELIAAPRSAVTAMTANAAVTGISPDWRGAVAGKGYARGQARRGVLAPNVVGGSAGAPDAGAGVTVALLDTGVTDSPALNRASGRLIDGVDVTHLGNGSAANNNDGTPTGPLTDGYGHGTFMASLIAGGPVAGSGDTALGVAPAAHVVVVKVAGSNGRTRLSKVLAGLDWVATHASKIQVVNLSLAVTRPTAPSYGSDPLTAAVELVRAAGVLVVAAAGNHPNQVGDPGIAPQALTVGAVSFSGNKARVAPFSGSAVVAGVAKPDVVAPGAHVIGEMSPHSTIAKKNPLAWTKDGLFLGSGTSEATAITSGAAAAYLGAHPGQTPLEVKAALRTLAQPLCSHASGAGLVRLTGGAKVCHGQDHSGVNVSADPAGEAGFDAKSWKAHSWLHGAWASWLASSWSASSWSASSWSASSWSASSWSASSWSASSWSASSWSASSWSDVGWGP